MERLRRAVGQGSLLLDLDASDLAAVFGQAVDRAVALGAVSEGDRDTIVDDLLTREQRFSTAIGHAVAVPHAYLEGLTDQVVVFVRLKRPLNMGAPDGTPTWFLFVLLGPPDHATEHLDTLPAIARLMSDEEFEYEAGEARNDNELLAALVHFKLLAPVRLLAARMFAPAHLEALDAEEEPEAEQQQWV